MGTTFFTNNSRLCYRQKFAIIICIAIVLLIASTFTGNTYLQWGSGIAFLIAMPFLILSVMEIVDKVNQ